MALSENMNAPHYWFWMYFFCNTYTFQWKSNVLLPAENHSVGTPFRVPLEYRMGNRMSYWNMTFTLHLVTSRKPLGPQTPRSASWSIKSDSKWAHFRWHPQMQKYDLYRACGKLQKATRSSRTQIGPFEYKVQLQTQTFYITSQMQKYDIHRARGTWSSQIHIGRLEYRMVPGIFLMGDRLALCHAQYWEPWSIELD